jgi:hypothetical protein
MNNHNYLASFNKLIAYNFVKHRGCLLERSGGGFRYGNQFFANLDEVDAEIDRRFEILNNSIIKHEKEKDNDTGA